MAANPTRRRWSYSLRTMFIALSLLSILLAWLGWQLDIVRQRKATRQWIEAHGGGVWEYAAGLGVTTNDASIPFWRTWLGDDAAPIVLMAKSLDSADETRVRQQFPEADIMTFENILPPGQLLPPPVRMR